MDIKILEKKPSIDINGDTYLDLSYNSFSSDNIFSQIIGFEIIDENLEMRPDLIAIKWYGDSKDVGLLLKVNNVFNPYSIKKGDIMIIPSLQADEKVYKNPGEIKKSKIREKFIDTSRMSKNDIVRLKALISKNKDKKNRLKNPIPVNILPEGRTNKKFTDDGQIILTNHHNTEA